MALIAFDARDAFVPMPHGSGIYVRRLLEAFRRVQLRGHELWPLVSGGRGAELWWEQVSFPRRLRSRGAGLVHSPDSFLPLRRPCPGVVTVHDLAFEAIPHDMRGATAWKYRTFLPRCARSAERVICPSRFTAQDRSERYEIPSQRIRVIPEAAEGLKATAPAQRPTGGFSVPAYAEGDNVEIEPMSKIRQITAAHMVYSKATSAHVTTVFHVDLSRVARLRARAKDGFLKKEGTKLTFMPFIFRAVVNGLKAYKKVNASIDGTNIVYKKDINLGMAVDLGHGLIVPVIKHADQLSLVGLARNANDLADRARNKKLKPDEVQGGTFTVTNPGVFGSLWGTPVINQPQVAILGVGAVEKRPIVVPDADGNDSIAIKTMCYLAITYDHRLVDGADADRFMIEVKKTLETDPWTELDAYS